MGIIIMIAQFFLCLSILIVLHEGGHYLAARMTGTRVHKFYLFFDFLFPFPNKWNFSLWKKKIGDTEYGLGWFPMGGYVAIAGMEDETQEKLDRPPLPDEYGSKNRPQKLLIMLGGVIVNFLLGFFIYAMIFWYYGENKLSNNDVVNGIYVDELGEQLGLRDGDKILAIGDKDFKYFEPNNIRLDLGLNDVNSIKILRNGQEQTITINAEVAQEILAYKNKNMEIAGPRVPYIFGKISKGKPAEKAGMMMGDSIVSLDGKTTPFQNDFLKGIRCRGGETIKVGYYREDMDSVQYASLTLDENSKMGVGYQAMSYHFDLKHIEYGFAESFPAGYQKGMNFIGTQFKAFGKMFSGKIKAKDSLGGFGSIGGLFSKYWDWHRFWTITAMLSLILAIMNLLPIPMLDGGYVLFLLIEMITRREIPENIMNVLMNIGLWMILALMVFANGMDIIRGLSGGVNPCG